MRPNSICISIGFLACALAVDGCADVSLNNSVAQGDKDASGAEEDGAASLDAGADADADTDSDSDADSDSDTDSDSEIRPRCVIYSINVRHFKEGDFFQAFF